MTEQTQHEKMMGHLSAATAHLGERAGEVRDSAATYLETAAKVGEEPTDTEGDANAG